MTTATAVAKTTLVELKIFARDVAAVFFTLALPLILLVLNGSGGNDPVPELGGAGPVDVMVPGYMAFVIATTGLTALPLTLATYRERGVLRRFSATPLSPLSVLSAHVLANAALTILGVAALVLVGALGFGLNAPADPLAVAVALLFATLTFFAISFALVGWLPRARTAQAVAFAVYFPSIFFSGAVAPMEFLPDFAQRIGEFLPATYVVDLLRDLWVGDGWNLTAVAVLAIGAGIALPVAARTFRWS